MRNGHVTRWDWPNWRLEMEQGKIAELAMHLMCGASAEERSARVEEAFDDADVVDDIGVLRELVREMAKLEQMGDA